MDQGVRLILSNKSTFHACYEECVLIYFRLVVFLFWGCVDWRAQGIADLVRFYISLLRVVGSTIFIIDSLLVLRRIED